MIKKQNEIEKKVLAYLKRSLEPNRWVFKPKLNNSEL